MTYIPPSLKPLSDLVGKKTTKISKWMGHQQSIQYAAKQAAVRSTTSAPHDLQKHGDLKPVLDELVKIDRSQSHALEHAIQKGGLSTYQRYSTVQKIQRVLEEREKEKFEKLVKEHGLDKLEEKPTDMNESEFKKKVEDVKKQKEMIGNKLKHELHQETDDVAKILGAMRHRYIPPKQTEDRPTTEVQATGAGAKVVKRYPTQKPDVKPGAAITAHDLANIKTNTTKKPDGFMMP